MAKNVKKVKSTEKEVDITSGIQKLKISSMKVKIIGTTPYLPEPMDNEVLDKYDGPKGSAKDQIVLTEAEKATKKYYYTDSGKYGMPVRGFYKSMIKASSYFYKKSEGGMRNIKEGITILGDIIPIRYKNIKQIQHWGRSSGQTKAPRKIIRNAFHEWETTLEIQYNSTEITPEAIINILNWAGFYIGVGGFRKECTGNFGMFEVVA